MRNLLTTPSDHVYMEKTSPRWKTHSSTRGILGELTFSGYISLENLPETVYKRNIVGSPSYKLFASPSRVNSVDARQSEHAQVLLSALAVGKGYSLSRNNLSPPSLCRYRVSIMRLTISLKHPKLLGPVS